MALISIDKFIGGLHKTDITSDIQLEPSEATDILNVEYYPRGAIARRDGYETLNMSAAAQTLSARGLQNALRVFGFEDHAGSTINLLYTPSATTNSASVYALSIANGVLTAQDVLSAQFYPTSMWAPKISAGALQVISYGGSALATYARGIPPMSYYSSSPASAKPETNVGVSGACVAAWGAYLFLGNVLTSAGDTEKSRVYWNSNGEIGTWPSYYFIDLDPDDGDEVIAMRLLSDYLVVFKRNKIFILYWVGGTLLFKEARRSSDIGCVAPNSIVERNKKLYFLADDGIYSFDGTDVREISKKIKSEIEKIRSDMRHLAHAGIYEKHRQLWFSVPTNEAPNSEVADGEVRCNRVFVFDYELENWTIYDIACNDLAIMEITQDTTWASLDIIFNSDSRKISNFAMSIQPELYLLHDDVISGSGSDAISSVISRFGGSAFDGISATPITTRWVSPWYDMQDQTTSKRLTRMTLIADQLGDQTLTGAAVGVKIHEDWKNTVYALPSGAPTTTSLFTIYLTGHSSSMCGETVESFRDNFPMEVRIDTSRTVRSWQAVLSSSSSDVNPWIVHRIIFDGLTKGKTKVT